jgi:hypothetical protein
MKDYYRILDVPFDAAIGRPRRTEVHDLHF